MNSIDELSTTENITWAYTNQPGEECPPTFFELLEGCDCVGNCRAVGDVCSCIPFGSTFDGTLLGDFEKPVTECKTHCPCSTTLCPHRITQRGVPPIEVFDTEHKGKGLRCTTSLPRGTFVCCYNGAILTKNAAKKRSNPYLLVVNEAYGERLVTTYVDAKDVGDWGRFVNHSCDPNLIMIPVRQDVVVPTMCLFALKDIPAGTELGYDYSGGCRAGLSDTVCRCGSTNCLGYLPFASGLYD